MLPISVTQKMAMVPTTSKWRTTMFITSMNFTALDIIDMIIRGKINPNPIGQRPPVSQGTTKSEHIISTFLDGYGIGMITLRDIRDDVAMQAIYPGTDYLVIDGGHRCRALAAFYQNKFAVRNQVFKTMDVNLDSFSVPVMSVVCTSEQATAMFRTINTVTPVNFIEMVMANEVSEVCKLVRVRTKAYTEYGNDPLPIFDTAVKKDGKIVSAHWDTAPNHRRKWDEYVFIAFLKAIGGGNVAAGERQIEPFADTGSITKTAIATADRFFEDVLKVRKSRGKMYNTDVFAALQLVWFGFFEKNKAFKISDYDAFTKSFMLAYSKLTGNADRSLEDTIIQINGESVLVKEFVRKNIKNFANADIQKKCFELIYGIMGDTGVLYRDENRSVNSNVREELLSLQEYKCAIDGLPLTIEDSVLGHDTPWAKGGSTVDGKVIRKTHNRDMGSVTIDEYKMILSLRGENNDV